MNACLKFTKKFRMKGVSKAKKHLLLQKYHEYGTVALAYLTSFSNSSCAMTGLSLSLLGSRKNTMEPEIPNITENTR